MSAALLMASVFWASALLSAPYVAGRHGRSPSLLRGASIVYVLGSLVCHQREERSFHPWGVRVPVCARCEGIYLAAPFGLAFVLGRRRRTAACSSRSWWRRVILLALVPTMATLVWEWSGGGMTLGIVRALAGAAIGVAIAGAVAAAAVDDLR
jgi:uncharacterized membrane protein